jgi:DNA-binding transcriptional MerR regulator
VTAEAAQGGVELRYRAEELAAEAGISVQVLRAYQSKGLVPPPRHVGRVAWYGPLHRERLDQIRRLKERGYSLRMIAESVDGDAAPGAVAGDERAVLRLVDVAERSGVPVEVLRALEASGLLRPQPVAARHTASGARYSEADVRFVRHVLALLGVGLSLDDLMRIARPLLETTDALGRDVVTAWSELVGRRLRRADRTDGAARVAESLRMLAGIIGQLVAYHVERAVLVAARADIDTHGSTAEADALTRALTAVRELTDPPG